MLKSLRRRGVTDVYAHNHEFSGSWWGRFGFECIPFKNTPDFILHDEIRLDDRLDDTLWDNGEVLRFYELTEEKFHGINEHATYLHLSLKN